MLPFVVAPEPPLEVPGVPEPPLLDPPPLIGPPGAVVPPPDGPVLPDVPPDDPPLPPVAPVPPGLPLLPPAGSSAGPHAVTAKRGTATSVASREDAIGRVCMMSLRDERSPATNPRHRRHELQEAIQRQR